MYYFVSEIQTDEGVQKTAGIKARDDVAAILKRLDMKELPVETCFQQREAGKFKQHLQIHFQVKKIWEKSVAVLKKGDVLLVQFPIIEHSIFLSSIFKKLKKRGVKLVLIIHDLELLRVSLRKDTSVRKKIRLNIEERAALFAAHRIVAHNEPMRGYLRDMGIETEQIIPLGIFDYLIDDYDEERIKKRENKKDMPVIVAGTLRRHKAKYAYELPDNQNYNLYGVGYEAEVKNHITYFGAFMPDELPYVLEGSFGLVWDGERADTCSGVYGEYLKINNPHKTSLYLASGIPVIIWNQAALAGFVREHNCGFSVGALTDIPEILSGMSEETYKGMCEAARQVGERLRGGYYLEHAVRQCLGK